MNTTSQQEIERTQKCKWCKANPVIKQFTNCRSERKMKNICHNNNDNNNAYSKQGVD